MNENNFMRVDDVARELGVSNIRLITVTLQGMKEETE